MFALVSLASFRFATVAWRAVLALGLAITLGFSTGARDDDTGRVLPPVHVPGMYAMSAIQGNAAPHTFTDPAGGQLAIEGGSLALGDSGTYELIYQGRLNALDFDLGDWGTYTVSGSRVTFHPDGDVAYTGVLRDGTVTIARKVAGVQLTFGFTAE